MSSDAEQIVKPQVRKRGGWKTAAIAVSLLIVAWAVVAVTPNDDDAQAPFFVDVTVGERATARNLAIAVNEITVTRAPTAGPWQMKAEDAVWVLVDLTAEATRTETLAQLSGALMRVGAQTFRASERPHSLHGTSLTMFRESLTVGIPTRGGLAFELPARVLDSTSTTLELSYSDETRLDSVIRLTVDLSSLPLTDAAELAALQWGTR